MFYYSQEIRLNLLENTYLLFNFENAFFKTLEYSVQFMHSLLHRPVQKNYVV